MQAAVMHSFGGPDVLTYGEVPTPCPKPDHVLVRVEAVGVNYYDTLIRSGAVSREIQPPHVGGSDVVGVVEARGEGVTNWAEGDGVIVAPGYPTDPSEQLCEPENEAPSYYPAGTFEWGGYAQFMEVHERWLLSNDIALPAEELATMPLVLVTAVHAVKTLGESDLAAGFWFRPALREAAAWRSRLPRALAPRSSQRSAPRRKRLLPASWEPTKSSSTESGRWPKPSGSGPAATAWMLSLIRWVVRR